MPKHLLLRLPPILCMHCRIPVSGWSKAPWGLSVLARVTSIFTGTSISPGVLSRQRSNHYAFRAGRNLPDKEFRYLRTVIVTAAVLLNSCLSLFSAAHSRGRPLSRSYGVILPSSLTVLLPSALGFSPHPPVSVYGTGLHHTIAAFLATGSKRFATLVRSASQPCVDHRFFQMVRSSACTGLFIPGSLLSHVSPQF